MGTRHIRPERQQNHELAHAATLGDNPYEKAANDLILKSGCLIRKWRKNTTGVAYTRADDWGIEVPRPRGPISFGTFAHEIGHQLLHRFNSAPRWLEEVEAWEYALEQFDHYELNGKRDVLNNAAKALAWAAHKANKRCSPETAQAILDRYPEWVWCDSARAMTYRGERGGNSVGCETRAGLPPSGP